MKTYFLFCILFSSASAEDNKIDMIVDFVKVCEQPTTVTAFLCWKQIDKLKLFQRLGTNLEIPTTVRFENKILKLENSPKDVIIIADLNCLQKDNIFNEVNDKMFRRPYRWLIVEGSSNSNEIVPEQIEDQDVLVDSEVIVARENENGVFEMYLIYKILPGHVWTTEYYGFWTKTNEIQKSTFTATSIPMRRRNLAKLRIPIAYNIDDKTTGVDLENSDFRIEHAEHSVSRWGYHQMIALCQFLNATKVNIFTNNWGYFVNGSWNGIIGCMARGEADLSGTPVFMSVARTEHASYFTNPVLTTVKFVFREPPLSYQNNLFLLPFSRAVWLTLAGFVVVLIIIIYVNAKWEVEKEHLSPEDNEISSHQQKLNISDVAMMVIGAISQQGSFIELRGSIGRIVMFILYLVFLFLFTAYSASIVALLQSSSKQIRTLTDLLNSRLELGVENNAYNVHYFTTAKDPVRKAIYETKVAPRGSKPKFMSVEEGVKKLQKHAFAFNMDVGVGYKIVEKYFYEHEKCGLQEIAYIPSARPWIIGRKGSPFIEIFKIGLSRLQEHGMAYRANSIVFSRKPVCRLSGGSFGSVSIIDVYPSLLMLLYGMILAFLLLTLEILVHRRQMGQSVYNGSRTVSRNSSIVISTTE